MPTADSPEGDALPIGLADGAMLTQAVGAGETVACADVEVQVPADVLAMRQDIVGVAAYYTDVQQHDGWSPARLTPLLAVLHENLPWLKQWHNDIDPEYHQRLGDFYETFLRSELTTLGLTEEDLRAWMPPNTAKSGRRV
jgi:hypothetical protein